VRPRHTLSEGSVPVSRGDKAKWVVGERVPIPKRTVSPQGTVSISGYEYIDVGYSCNVETWRTPEGVGVRVAPSISSVVGYVEEAPRVATRSVEGVAHLRDGSYLILSGLDEWREERSGPQLGVGGRSTDRVSRVVFVLRADKVLARDALD
jgi:type II secretory pathway component GspD/PulD (secretin)